MKRYTMTPISRKMQKLPLNGNKTPLQSRPSFAPEEKIRRDVRMLRDPNYKKTCSENVYKFLSENNFEGNLSQKTLQNPSNKDFQLIFKFIFSFIDDYEYTNKFEDDVINILKIIKYPYASEITRSQLTAITPHMWPIVLSMLSWLIDIMLNLENFKDLNSSENNIETFFNEFVSNGYLNYLQGNDDDQNLEEDFENNVQVLYSDLFKKIDLKKDELKKLEKEILELKSGFGDIENLEQKKNDLLEDLNSLISSQKQLENKKSKYSNIIKKTLEEIEIIENELKDLRNQHEEIKNKIEVQKLNPEDVKIMNKEKVELYEELEKITPEKEKLMINNKNLEKNLSEVIDEIEKLMFDFNNLREDLNFKFLKNFDKKFFNRDFDETRRTLENEHNKAIQRNEELKINKDTILNTKEEKEIILKDIETKIEYNQNKLISTGEIYLKKKKISEDEQKKNKNQMEGLERELLQLNLESNSSLIQSEQGLHKNKISLDIINNKCKQEKEAIKNLIFNFQNNMMNYKVSLKRINEKLQNLKNQQEN
ncbi:putative kinetochore protein NDC80 [Vairimorpha necatrix]|uniref:Kinetochore protein NDC80 n=1 Tax=Vairimorpha necatrix TaxID=6039 RepID=A0AAX4JDQ1_9MICR